MLSDYKDKQSLVYNLFMNDINNKCVTHAYLIDENNSKDAFPMIMAFVKKLLCSSDHDENKECSLCKQIDNGSYSELKIIEPDGLYIKKNQIIELQKEFSKSAVLGNRKIYIIRDCDKMRAESANSMLKFLEEPEDDIVAILMTNNINNVLSTIISRCKVVKFNSNGTIKKIDDNLENLAIDFVYKLEQKRIDMILSIKDDWFNLVASKDRENMILVFDKIVDIYYNALNVKVGKNNIKYEMWKDKILEIVDLNSIDDIITKINIFLEYKDSIKFNVNSNLLMDSLIISIGGVKDDSRY